MQKIMTHLWFETEAEEAARFYTSIFDNSRIVDIQRYEGMEPAPPTVTVVTFELAGQQFIALNGGPEFKFNEAVSLYIDCADQQEVDSYWDKLTADGGEEGPCGWLKDKYGLSWQVIPTALTDMLGDPDPEKSKRVMQAMLQMKKIDVRGLKSAYEKAG